MKEVKTQQRYKCDFCKKRGIKKKIAFHETNCYMNPNRVCSACNNTGKVLSDESFEGHGRIESDCQYCARYDHEKFEAIERHRKGLEPIKRLVAELEEEPVF